jgi:TolB-like protein
MKKCLSFIVICALLVILSCVSQEPEKAKEPVNTETGITLDMALSDIASYYVENLPRNTKIALISFEAEARLLADYIFEELWIRFEDSRFFVLIDRKNLELIQKEIDYQYSGMVSDESMQSIGHQLGAQTLVYGNITQVGNEYRLVVRATDVEKAVTSIRSATLKADRRFTALLENKADGKVGESMANALYSGLDNPWRFTVQTDKTNGDYHDGEYMTMRIYSERDAWFKVTHIDVNGNAQMIYPVLPNDNNFIKAGQTRQIPDNTLFRMTKPYGEEMILVGAYEKPFVVQSNSTGPLSNNLLVRSITAERADSRTEMRPVTTAKFTYSIGP